MTSHVAIIGGGHNGLVAANYLARSGHRVTILEAQSRVGGPVRRVEYLPGYFSSVTNSPGSLEGRVIQELELEKFGLRYVRPDITLLQHLRGRLFIGWRDRERIASQLEEFSPGESERQAALVQRLDRIGAASGLSMWNRPERLSAVLATMSAEDRAEFESVALNGSLMDLLDGSLHSDEAKTLMMMLALNGQLVSPHAAGSAIGLLLRPISRASSTVDILGIGDVPLRGSVGLISGSMSSIVDALELSARVHGVNIRTSAPVARIDMDDEGRAAGITLESGERVTGVDHIVSTVEPSRLRDMLPANSDLASAAPQPPTGSSFKIALALDRLPEVAGAPSEMSRESLFSSQFRIAPDTEYVTTAVKDGIADRPSSAPIMWGLVPSVTSPGLAPHGKHLMSLNVWHAPYSLGREYWRENGQAFVDSCLSQLELSFPGLKSSVSDAAWLTPHDLEEQFGLTGSNITHGDMVASELLERPAQGFTESLAEMGIVLGGAGTWPGGYVSGIPGRNAACVIQEMSRSRS